jgi:DNA helicase-2/ATP-dependent DNA helicase PcrA
MPLNLQITDGDINRVADEFRLDFSDEARRQALRNVKTIDIQAGPGSGKTTLLVAKLAVLASKWVWRDRGILVLSHTNVARREIEKRAVQHPTAHRILEYPHFVGTIQQFVDRYLALPYLRHRGWATDVIDSSRCDKHFASSFESDRSCYTARASLSHSRNREEILETVRFTGPTLSLGWPSRVSIGFGEDSSTYQQLHRLKTRIASIGYHKFDDMYAYAQAYLGIVPELRAAFCRRFPWVFVDELQDTNATQNEIICGLFHEDCVLQRLGDQNQAIFSDRGVDSSQALLFREDALDLPTSIRFGPSLATLATQLTVRHQGLEGNMQVRGGRHTMFLFGPNRIQEVLPQFSELLLSEYPDGFPPGFIAKALGRIAKNPGPNQMNKVPYCIADYWAGYNESVTNSVSRLPGTLIEYTRLARHYLSSRFSGRDAFTVICDAVVGSLRTQGVRTLDGKAFTRTSFRQILNKSDLTTQRMFWRWCWHACLDTNVMTAALWTVLAGEFRDGLERFTGCALSEVPDEFFQWKDHIVPQGVNPVTAQTMNVFPYPSIDPRVEIHFGTIHSAKGETHSATLVLETFFYDHDIKKLIPYMIEQPGDHGHLSARKQDWMRCVFVGATRPRELLCFAVRGDHVNSNQRVQLASRGWNLVTLE